MTISQLIEQLTRVQERDGDVDGPLVVARFIEVVEGAEYRPFGLAALIR